MNEIMPGVENTEDSNPAAGPDGSDEQLINQLIDRAKSGGLQPTGEGGVLQQLTKRLLESALEGEITDHPGYDKHDPVGRDTGNSRNGTRSKTVLTDVGPVEVTVPRDREGSFEPKIVAKRQKRMTGVDEMVISLSAKGLTTGEVQAHLAEVYGAEASRQTISTLPRQGGRGHGRMAEPAPGPGVPGDLHRRDQRQDPRREGRQPADLRLTWRDLVGWWNEQHPGRGTERDAARELYNPLVKSLGDNPVEKILFRTYAEFYGHPDGFDLPALIPQVYLHYDPYTKRQLGDRPGQLERQRMDFLLLMPRRRRVVLEVDGRQHYAQLNGTADPIRYSKMVPKTAR